MNNFARRNLLVFFKDRATVFFSLLAVFIIIGLYVLFLGDVWSSGFTGMSGVRYLMDSWIMAGVLAVTSVTTTMGAFGTMIDDKSRKISKDIYVAPLSRSSITGGYIVSSFVIGVIMSLITLVLAELYIVLYGGALLALSALLKVLGLIVFSTFANMSLILFLVSFFRSNNAFASASTIIGTLIGFLTGIYLPIGQLPTPVQWVIKLFPVSHSAALFRQVMMADAASATFSGAPAEVVRRFNESMGVFFSLGKTEVTPLMSIAYMLISAVIFYTLAGLNLSRKAK
ncbi:MAG: ABC transporter permease [Clostridiales bacterium]|jgi:multidrug/hemolysin transport system permease protein|nr:ABC transporter permease [Clostridiales bacterium]